MPHAEFAQVSYCSAKKKKKVSQIFGSKFKQCDEESITFPAAAAAAALVAVIVIVLPMEMCPSKRNSNSHSSSNTHTNA